VVEQPHRIGGAAGLPAGGGAEALHLHRAGHDGEAVARHAQALHDLLREALAADQQRVRVVQHAQHGLAVGAAAAPDPMAVAALDGDHGGDAQLARRQQHGPAVRVAVLGVQDVERLLAVLGQYGGEHVVHVALEVGAARLREALLAERAAADHLHAGHGRGRAAAVDARARRVAAVLAHHGHVVAGSHQWRSRFSA
jgi:hypothetical protein